MAQLLKDTSLRNWMSRVRCEIKCGVMKRVLEIKKEHMKRIKLFYVMIKNSPSGFVCILTPTLFIGGPVAHSSVEAECRSLAITKVEIICVQS